MDLSVANWLSRTEACRDLSDDDRRAIAAAGTEQEGWEGVDLVRQGDEGDTMLLVLSGEVAILKADAAGHVRELARAGSGTLIGETALLEAVPRTATVRALKPVRYFELGRSAFHRLVDVRPTAALGLMQGVARSLARRNRMTNERLVQVLVELTQRGIEPPDFNPYLHDLIIEVE